MKMIVLVVLSLFFIALGLAGIFGAWRTYRSLHSPNQKLFQAGTITHPLPDGDYKGKVRGYNGNWQGKRFVASENRGINIFATDSGFAERYPFHTKTSPGVWEKNTSTLKIDYNQAGNPLWIRPVLDEIVETTPGHYLGKIHYRILPGITITFGYFQLTQAESPFNTAK